jgi:hypothetical protein
MSGLWIYRIVLFLVALAGFVTLFDRGPADFSRQLSLELREWTGGF